MIATDLLCEYLINPLGIDALSPVLSWKAKDGIRQTAFEVVCLEGGKPCWQSGRRDNSSMHVKYEGRFKSRDHITWKVRLWDEKGEPGEWSEEAFFEAGLLDASDWQAAWIAGVNTETNDRLPVDCFRKEFSVVPDKAIDRARLYITSQGTYQFFVDGVRNADSVLMPGCSQFNKHLYYQTYDIGKYLRDDAKGEKSRHVLKIQLADGWYKGKVGSDNSESFYGDQLKVFAQLEITYADGSRDVIATDDSFDWCNDGPFIHTDLKDGLVCDLNRKPSYKSKAVIVARGPIVPEDECVKGTVTETAEPARLLASCNPYVKEQERFKAELIVSPSGNKILDFGQNISGYVKCHFPENAANAGRRVALSLGVVLDKGEFANYNFRDAYGHGDGKTVEQQEVFILSGKDETCQPDFFYSGFQYALIEGLEEVNPADFEAIAVYSDVKYKSSFECSNEMINRFYRNTIWSQKDNFVDVPTDCPTREKSAWTGDAQVFIKTALYNADAAAFYKKWLVDVRDCQREDGRIDNVCPKIRGIQPRDALEGSAGWGDAAVIIPYTLWKYYGDTSFITDNMDLITGWMNYLIAAGENKMIYHLPEDNMMAKMFKPYLLEDFSDNKYIVETGIHWGEWSEPKDVYDVPTERDLVRPKQEETCAYYHYSMSLLEEMYRAVGMDNKAEKCHECAEGSKRAYQHHFVRDKRPVNAISKETENRPCKYVRPLALGLLDKEEAAAFAEHLNDICIARDYRIGTGFLSTPFILPLLADYGYADTAYKMLANTKEPGWLAMVENGATTVWESYNGFDADGHPRMISFNHYSPGAVCSFLYEYVCGVRVTGENEFAIAPVPHESLDHAKCEVQTPYGKVMSGWEKTGKNETGYDYKYRITIPANCSAEVTLPGQKTVMLAAGEYIL